MGWLHPAAYATGSPNARGRAEPPLSDRRSLWARLAAASGTKKLVAMRICMRIGASLRTLIRGHLLRPFRRPAVPAMPAESGDQFRRQRTGVARGQVGPDVGGLPHPGDDRRHVGVGKD